MEMTFQLSNEIIQQLRQLPNPDQFVGEVLKNALRSSGIPNSTVPSQPSKWAQLVERIHEQPGGLRGYSTQLQHDMQEFRDNFAFSQEVNDDVSS